MKTPWILAALLALAFLAGCADDDDDGREQEEDTGTAEGTIGVTGGGKGAPGLATPLAIIGALASVAVILARRRNKD